MAKTRHVCEKPVPLMRRAVRLVTRPGAIVCDPFAGIASTGVAAILERCRFIGAEINASHHRLGSRRVEEALGAEACPD